MVVIVNRLTRPMAILYMSYFLAWGWRFYLRFASEKTKHKSYEAVDYPLNEISVVKRFRVHFIIVWSQIWDLDEKHLDEFYRGQAYSQNHNGDLLREISFPNSHIWWQISTKVVSLVSTDVNFLFLNWSNSIWLKKGPLKRSWILHLIESRFLIIIFSDLRFNQRFNLIECLYCYRHLVLHDEIWHDEPLG